MKDKQHPLLTKNQLIDWLIYHRPLKENYTNEYPFAVEYNSLGHGFYTVGMTPWEAYESMASHITAELLIHREITDLYWYWTI